jgi:hypothetical protein
LGNKLLYGVPEQEVIRTRLMTGKASTPLVISDIAVANKDCTGDIYAVLAGDPHGQASVSPEDLLSQFEKLPGLWRKSKYSAALKLKRIKALNVTDPAAVFDFYSLLSGSLQVAPKI